MNPETMSKEDLRTEFEQAAREAINEADFVTRKQAREIVSQRLQKVDEPEPSPEDEPSDEEPEIDDADRFTRDELKEELPEDIWAAVQEYLDAEDVAKALGTETVDGYLAKQHTDLAATHGVQVEAAERQQQAAAESVGTSTPVLDRTVYDGEEGA